MSFVHITHEVRGDKRLVDGDSRSVPTMMWNGGRNSSTVCRAKLIHPTQQKNFRGTLFGSISGTPRREDNFNNKSVSQRGAMRLKHAIVLCIMAMVLALLSYNYVTMQKAATNISKQYEQEKLLSQTAKNNNLNVVDETREDSPRNNEKLLSQTKKHGNLDTNDKKLPEKLHVREKPLSGKKETSNPNAKEKRRPHKQYQRLYRQNTSLPVGFNDRRVPSNIESLKSNDQRLIDVIRDVWIEPPSNLPNNFNRPKATLRSQHGQDKILDEMMKHKTDGFFVEAGAADGEHLSNTLFFETERHWTGLLIEPDPIAYTLLKTKHRKAYAINSCLAANVSKMKFHAEFIMGGLHDFIDARYKKSNPMTLQCFPLHAMLQAINHTTVDFFSLDVEGAEPHVLRGIDFSKVDIKVLVIESNHCGSAVLKQILEPAGYQFVKKLLVDDVFVKRTNP
ncbi:hypothetical protein ScPMuIL_018297 [Solemya velum]